MQAEKHPSIRGPSSSITRRLKLSPNHFTSLENRHVGKPIGNVLVVLNRASSCIAVWPLQCIHRNRRQDVLFAAEAQLATWARHHHTGSLWHRRLQTDHQQYNVDASQVMPEECGRHFILNGVNHLDKAEPLQQNAASNPAERRIILCHRRSPHLAVYIAIDPPTFPFLLLSMAPPPPVCHHPCPQRLPLDPCTQGAAGAASGNLSGTWVCVAHGARIKDTTGEDAVEFTRLCRQCNRRKWPTGSHSVLQTHR